MALTFFRFSAEITQQTSKSHPKDRYPSVGLLDYQIIYQQLKALPKSDENNSIGDSFNKASFSIILLERTFLNANNTPKTDVVAENLTKTFRDKKRDFVKAVSNITRIPIRNRHGQASDNPDYKLHRILLCHYRNHRPCRFRARVF